jgi:site-specific DNA-methyltransferase (adenine-specific)
MEVQVISKQRVADHGEVLTGKREVNAMQDFAEPWTDEKLYKKYGLTKEEIAFIETIMRPMEGNDE